jgi:hypothetical protein
VDGRVSSAIRAAGRDRHARAYRRGPAADRQAVETSGQEAQHEAGRTEESDKERSQEEQEDEVTAGKDHGQDEPAQDDGGREQAADCPDDPPDDRRPQGSWHACVVPFV